MSNLTYALLLATLGGITIPIGGLLGTIRQVGPNWLDREFRHSVIAFGGGALLSAVALVLVPEGALRLSVAPALFAFGAGGVGFFLLDRLLEKRGGSGAQLMAMLLDFLPESLALGALLAADEPAGLLLAFLIAVQNLPEGFNSYREISRSSKLGRGLILLAFCALVLLGPACAYLGFTVLGDYREVLAFIMLFASGGILYLTFEDIAPAAVLERHWAPPLGAVAGFMLGLAGHMMVG
jgi:zinc transporter, ZIP family